MSVRFSEATTENASNSSTSNAAPTSTGVSASTAPVVQFKTRCETLGFGEDVYLVPLLSEKETSSNDPPSIEHRHKMIPLYTTAQAFPWYSTLSPLALPTTTTASFSSSPSPPGSPRQPRQLFSNMYGGNSNISGKAEFQYRYAIYRGGVFHRWENAGDENFTVTINDEDGLTHNNTDFNATQSERSVDAISVHTNESTDKLAAMDINTDKQEKDYHVLPLRFLQAGETYVVRDVLGKRRGQKPDLYHKRPLSSGNGHSYVGVNGSGAEEAEKPEPPKSPGKHVGFAPTPPSPRRSFKSTHSPTKSAAAGNATSATTAPNARAFGGGDSSVQLNETDGLVVVSAFLPVVVHRSDSGQWSADWDYEALLSMQTLLRVTRVGVVKWKGWHGNYNAETSNKDGKEAAATLGVPEDERHLVEECLRPFNCVPVWIDPLVFGEMYNGFCKGVLWPVLHNVTSVYASHRAKDDEEAVGGGGDNIDINTTGSASPTGGASQFTELCRDDFEQGPLHGGRGREKALWSAYNQVNRKFSEVVVQCFNEGDLVWIHGFHLLILPSYLTRRISMAKIGIFLHTPFPSSEIFRTLWCREDLLRGMLNADQVGFHLFEYARHFLTCCRRLLGLNYGMIPDASGNGGYTLAIDTNGRHVAVTSIHAGIEPPVLNQFLKHESVIQEAESIRAQHPNKTIFCSIGRLESLKGIPLRLLAIERFLKRCPEWIGKIILIQIGITAWERGDDYIKTRDEVEAHTKRINAMWPGTILFEERPDWKMRLQQRLALMKACDVCVVTPIRDGLNLFPLEFTMAHQDALIPAVQEADGGRRRGLVILSEFASCTRVMRGALHVNPWKISEIAQAFQQALTMSDEERLRRLTCASEFVTRVTTQRWALAVMLDLKGVHKSANPVQYSGAGLGLGFRLLGMDVGYESLDFKAVAKAYKLSSQRLILFDYGGTITSNENLDNLSRFRMVKTRSHHSEPTKEMINTIQDLCNDKKNTVFVVSGKERHSLIKTLGHIPNLGLAAEHGMYISWPEAPGKSTKADSPSRKAKKRHWDTLVPITDTTWRPLTMSIMEIYASRTHGSYIEETEMKVLWQYRDADLEFGYQQARELEDHLSNVLRNYAVDILHGGVEEGGYVEVRPKGVNKGVFAMKAICCYDKITNSKSGAPAIDFALVLGDDHCDEPMLSVMRQVGHRVHGGNASELPMTMRLVDVSLCDANVSNDAEIFTCTVGKKPSAASNYLQDVSEVEELLQALVKVSKNPNASKSMLDLMRESQAALDMMDDSEQSGMQFQSPQTAVSTNLNQFLGGIDDAEEDDMFF